MEEHRINELTRLLNEKEELLKEQKSELEDQQEEFSAQREELAAAVEELMAKNSHLTNALNKLQQRNQELDHILYHASHDLKTPVSSIYGLINILRSGSQADQQTAITHLLEQARLMNLKLDGLTNLSNAFFREPRLVVCSIRQLFMLAWAKIENQGSIRLLLPEGDEEINTDRELFVVAIKCLLDNGVAYRRKPEGHISVAWWKKDNTLELNVSDDGEGVDPKISRQIFDMFYRGSERSKGAGLGLYITKIIAEKLHGVVEYIPSKDETTFRLKFPVGA